MFDLKATIKHAQKLGFDYYKDDRGNFFELTSDKVSLPFANFIHSLSGLKVLASEINNALSEANTNIGSGYASVAKGATLVYKEKGKRSKKLGKPLTTTAVKHIKNLLGNFLGSLETAQESFSAMFVITLVSKFEAYIQDITAEISRHYPETMRSGKMISFNEVLQFTEMLSLIEYLAVNVSTKSIEGTVTEYICRLGNNFGIPICDFKDIISELEYYVDIRHIQVHNNGLIDSKFYNKYPLAGKLGDRILLDYNSLAEMSLVFRHAINLLEVMLVEKYPNIATHSKLDRLWAELEWIYEGEQTKFADYRKT